jgi:hypothetical protein
LQASAAVSAFAATGVAGAALAAEPTSLQLQAVIYDSRFDEARAFAAAAARLGRPVRAINGDVTRLWFEELQPAWAKAPAPIGGLTSVDALFCLERLAWDHGMRTVLRGEHAPTVRGETRHQVYGGAAPELIASELELAGGQWPQRLAEMLARRPVGSRRPDAASTLGGSSGLVSWVIAPVRRT